MPESQTTSETATNNAETREPSKSELDQVAALLRGEDESTDESGDAGDQESNSDNSDASSETNAQRAKPKTLEAIAEALGVEVKDLYDITVPFSVGDDVQAKTLGEIKDQISERDNFEVDRLAWEEQRTTRENELMKSNQELTDIVSMLPRSAISPELVSAVASKRAAAIANESELTKKVIPAWTDETVEAKDRETMREHLSAYGYPANYLDQVVDHRTLRYIRESMLREQRVTRALEQVKTVRKPGHKPSTRPTKTAARSSNRPTSRNASQLDQVNELLKTG